MILQYGIRIIRQWVKPTVLKILLRGVFHMSISYEYFEKKSRCPLPIQVSPKAASKVLHSTECICGRPQNESKYSIDLKSQPNSTHGYIKVQSLM